MKILYTVNGTPKSESIIPFVADLARRWGAEILIVQGVEPVPIMGNPVAPLYAERYLKEVCAAGEDYLRKIAAQFPDIATRTFCLPGFPGESIRQLAAEERCDLIIMASNGHAGFVRWLWGSVAEGMARKAPCPVLLVRQDNPSAFEKILVPFDGSDPSWNVVEHLSPFIAAPLARITLLHCSDSSGQELDHQLRCQTKNLADGYPLLNLETTSTAAPEGIVQWLRAHPCDLIAMSTHGRTGMAHFWRGSVMEQVAREAECPVLVFPSALVQDRVIT